jgi:hypothetical protein
MGGQGNDFRYQRNLEAVAPDPALIRISPHHFQSEWWM